MLEKGQKEDKLLRIIDVNINRAEEGLRVVEDIIRFFLEEKSYVEQIKMVRHSIWECAKKYFSIDALITSRTKEDIGRSIHTGEEEKRTILDVLHANLKRVQQALRVLEEISKIKEGGWKEFKDIRYKVYGLEKEILDSFKRSSSICNSR